MQRLILGQGTEEVRGGCLNFDWMAFSIAKMRHFRHLTGEAGRDGPWKPMK